MSEIASIPVSKISVNNLTTYSEFLEPLPESKYTTLAELGLPDTSKASGQVTRKVRLRLKNVIKSWYSALRYTNKAKKNTCQLYGKKFKFVTLTLPSTQFHTDREIKRSLLRPFIQRLVRNYNIERWVWKAERQGNGNIHFHLLFDEFVHWRTLRDEWNKDLKRMGYLDQYAAKWKNKDKDGFQFHQEFAKSMNREQQYKAYLHRVNTNYSDPNTTDIHNLYGIRNAESYMTKYVAKEEAEMTIDGKVWDKSDNLQVLSNYVDQNGYDIGELIKLMNRDKRFFKYEGDYFTSYSGPIMDVIFEHFPSLGIDIANHFEACLHANVPEKFESPP